MKLKFDFFTLAANILPPKIQMPQYLGNLIPDKERERKSTIV